MWGLRFGMGSAAWCTSKEKTSQFSVVPNCPIILKLLLGQQIWHWWSNSTRICVLSQRVQNSCKFGCYLEMKPMRDTPWEDISQELILFTKNYDLFREHQKLEPMIWADFAILKSTHFLARVCSPFGQLWEIWALSLTSNLIFFSSSRPQNLGQQVPIWQSFGQHDASSYIRLAKNQGFH